MHLLMYTVTLHKMAQYIYWCTRLLIDCIYECMFGDHIWSSLHSCRHPSHRLCWIHTWQPSLGWWRRRAWLFILCLVWGWTALSAVLRWPLGSLRVFLLSLRSLLKFLCQLEGQLWGRAQTVLVHNGGWTVLACLLHWCPCPLHIGPTAGCTSSILPPASRGQSLASRAFLFSGCYGRAVRLLGGLLCGRWTRLLRLRLPHSQLFGHIRPTRRAFAAFLFTFYLRLTQHE